MALEGRPWQAATGLHPGPFPGAMEGDCLDSTHTIYNLTWEDMHAFLTL